MKHQGLFVPCPYEKSLYPTWFRWNHVLILPLPTPPIALYPTWFRWNYTWPYILYAQWILYIPHGSDETHTNKQTDKRNKTFISHMVQMKLPYPIPYPIKALLYIPHGSDETQASRLGALTSLAFISHMVQMKHIYPATATPCTITFISHMVQMKHIHLSYSLLCVWSLYPTWFRWNLVW